jgi:hypothetical protein
MSNTMNAARMFCLRATSVFMLAMVAIGAWGQDTTTTTVKHGEKSFDTQVKNAEVVYVEGNDLVLKVEDGKIEHLTVPDTDKFTIDGKDVTVRELVPGTKLTQTITTTTAPRYVTTVRVLKGKVWHVNPPRSVILALPDHTNQAYTVPDHAKFTIVGRKKPVTVFDLRKGMTLEATIVTDDTHTVIEQAKSVVGEAPAPTLPQEMGVLLFFHPSTRPAPISPVMMASAAEPAPASLPETGTRLPLMGLLGTLAVAMSFGLGAARRVFVKA